MSLFYLRALLLPLILFFTIPIWSAPPKKSCSEQLLNSEEVLKGREKTKIIAQHLGLNTKKLTEKNSYKRKKKGKGWAYYDTRNRHITDKKIIERIKSLTIPPAWKEVWISPDPKNYLQASGLDDSGKRQPRQHSLFTKGTADYKFNSTIRFGHVVGAIRSQALRDLKTQGLNQSKLLAAIVLLLDETLIRVGTKEIENNPTAEEKEAKKKAYGLTKLKLKHMKIKDNELHFDFIGKKGVHHKFHITIVNPELLQTLIDLKKLRKGPFAIREKLFKYVNNHGDFKAVHSNQVSKYIRDASGNGFTPKDFRTWRASVYAAEILAEYEPTDNMAQRKRNLKEAMDLVAEKLHNTGNIARSSYVHPAIIHAYLEEGFDFLTIFKSRGRPKLGLSKAETVVLKWLDENS